MGRLAPESFKFVATVVAISSMSPSAPPPWHLSAAAVPAGHRGRRLASTTRRGGGGGGRCSPSRSSACTPGDMTGGGGRCRLTGQRSFCIHAKDTKTFSQIYMQAADLGTRARTVPMKRNRVTDEFFTSSNCIISTK